MDYNYYNVEDLAADPSFIDWVNQEDPRVNEFWQNFLSDHPEQRRKIEQAKTLVLNLRQSQTIGFKDEQIDQLWEKVSERVFDAAPEKSISRKTRFVVPVLVSFSVILAVSVWYGYNIFQRQSTGDTNVFLSRVQDEYVEEVNASGNIMRIHLSDGSIVILESESKLQYKKDYSKDSTRHVFLSGEAFFEVAKNPYKPFFVHANDVVTEVLGTSFNVQARQDDKDVVVSVKTGRVSVYSTKNLNASSEREKNGVILLPNQQVMYSREKHSFDKRLVEAPAIVIPSVSESDFVFDNTPVNQVLRKLQEAYGVEIIFNEDIMTNCFITAPLGTEPLLEKLRIICQTIGASYEIVDAKVIISSPGC